MKILKKIKNNLPYIVGYLAVGLIWSIFRNFTAFSGLPFDFVRFLGDWLLFPISIIAVIGALLP